MTFKSALAASALALSGAAHAGYLNTGLDSSGNLVATPGGIDGNWDVTPPGADAVTYYNAVYAANDADSQWISSNAQGGGETTVATNYTFITTFDLTGKDPLTASLTGSWGVDNWATIYLNGADTGVSLPYGPNSFNVLHAFSINSGFVAGVNTLEVMVTNAYETDPSLDPGPMALRFDDMVLRARDQVPEPGLLGLLGLGLVGMGIARRRR